MEAMVPGKPLAFLDHRIVCGNALLGVTPELLALGVPDDAFKALTGDDKSLVTSLKKRNKAERAGQGTLDFASRSDDLQHTIAERYVAIDEIADDDVAGLVAKEERWLDLQHSNEQGRAQLAADAWCAAFVVPKATDAPEITSAFVRQAAERPSSALDVAKVDAVISLREQYRFLHFHLAFPHVFDGSASEGFSCVLGNPPWERVKLQEREFFAERSPEVAAAPNAASRRRLITKLQVEDPDLFESFREAVRRAEGESHFLRTSGRYPLCGVGRDINTFTVFAESMRDALCLTGRAGVIVPTGIATDDTSKHFFADLVEKASLVSLYDFENSSPTFVGVHRSFKFCLLTLTGSARPANIAEFVFYAVATTDLGDSGRRFTLTPEDFSLLNPNTKTCPVFRSRRDAELTRSIYESVPALVVDGTVGTDSWSIETRPGLFHMGNDAAVFQTPSRADPGSRLYESKMCWFFDHRWSDADSDRKIAREDPLDIARPRYEVPRSETKARLGRWKEGWLAGFRDVTNSNNERTLVPVLLPLCAVGHNCTLAVSETVPAELPLLIANGSSFVADYVARTKVGGSHMSSFIFRQLPLLAYDRYRGPCRWSDGSLRDWVIPRVAELSCTAWDLAPLAISLGFDLPPFRWDSDRRPLLRAELDAGFFHLYGIERADVEYIMSSFPIVERRDEAAFGEYLTKRVILEVYDAIADAIASGKPYRTILDPPPADLSLCHSESTRPDWASRL